MDMQSNPPETPGVRVLADLLAYQEGAVVSRVLLKKRSGTVTLFAFAAGEGLSEHTTPYEALLYVVDGAAEVTVGGTQHRVEAGQLIALPADVPHAVHAPADFKMLLVMIREREQG
jgi:quercetin dioxygenase-like cupin family protein